MMTMKDINGKSVAELSRLLVETKAELATVKMKVFTNQEKHVHKVNELKTDVARILTALNANHND